MKIGETSDPTYAISAGVRLGYQGAPFPHEEGVAILEAVDHTVFDVIDYGNRAEHTADFLIDHLTTAQYQAIRDYLMGKAGARVRFELENIGERVFGESITDSVFYAWIVRVDGKGEADYSNPRRLWSIALQIAYAGTTSTSGPSVINQSLFDLLFKVDTVRAAFTQAAEPVATALDQRWLDTDDRRLYEWDGSAWVYLYTVAADSTTYNFVNGVFWWSSFGDLTSASPGVPAGVTYKSGLVNRRSFAWAGPSVSISRGPALARREGFKFSVDNADLFWAWVVSNQVGIVGAQVSVSVYDRANSRIEAQASGINNNNSFDYQNYEFHIEPKILNHKKIFPADTLDPTLPRYLDLRPDLQGKTVIRTYGRHEYAKLQEVSKADRTVEVADGVTNQEETALLGVTREGPSLTSLLLRRTDPGGGGHWYTFTADQLAILNQGDYTLTVLDDSDATTASANERQILRILDVEEIFDYYRVTVEGGLAEASAGTLVIAIESHTYKWQMDDILSRGFGDLQLFTVQRSSGGMVPVPVSAFEINADRNMVTLHPALLGGSDAILQYQRAEALPEEPVPWGGRDIYGAYSNERTPVQMGLTAPTFPSSSILYEQFYRGFVWAYDYDGQCMTQAAPGTAPFSLVFGANPNTESGLTSQMGVRDNQGFALLVYKVSHAQDKTRGLIDASEVKLVVDFLLKVENEWHSSEFPKATFRSDGADFKIRLRARYADGSYHSPSATWEYAFTFKNLGVNGQRNHIRISNVPDGTESGPFRAGDPEASVMYDYLIQWIFPTEAAMNSHVWASGTRQPGDLVIINHATAANRKIFRIEYAGPVAGWSYVEVVTYTALPDGTRIYYPVANSTDHGVFVKDVSIGSPFYGWAEVISLDELNPEVNRQTFGSREMFDLSELFAVSKLWTLIESLEIQVVTMGQTNGRTENGWSHNRWRATLTQQSAPELYMIQTHDFKGEDLFAGLSASSQGGRHISTPANDAVEFRTRPIDILDDILREAYPGAYDQASLVSLGALSGRNNWIWRKQYDEAKAAEDVLLEALWNIWAVGVLDETDTLKLKSLNLSDHSTVKTFTDSNICRGSITFPTMRPADETYQRYSLKHQWNPGLEKHASETLIDHASGPDDLTALCKLSKDLYGLKNTFAKNLDFFGYDLHTLPEMLIRFLSLNGWAFKFRGSMRDVIYSASLSGTTRIRIMDVVAVNSYFLTNGSPVRGFVVGLRPLFYDGVVEYSIFSPEPPGGSAWGADPWKDALFDARDNAIMGFDDAGDTSRDSGTYPFHERV